MRLSLHKFIAVFLVLSLGFAGLMGLSPALHHLVEHGGEGVPHIHAVRGHLHHKPATVRASAGDLPSSGDSRPHLRAVPAVVSGTSRFVHSPDAFPGVDVLAARFWHRLQHFFESRNGPESNAARGDDADHHHETLSGTLAGGLVDCSNPSFDRPQLQRWFVVATSSPNFRFPAFEWNSFAAPRGPPPASI